MWANRAIVLAALVMPFTAPLPAQQKPPDSASAGSASAGDVIIERYANDVTFAADGTSRRETTVRARIQSEAGLKAWGVVTLSYRNDVERVEKLEIQVRKPDGRVVPTPESNVQDLAAEVTREAPTYTDVREKQAPVKSLGVGDVLEWHAVVARTKAEAPGQFWDAWSFLKEGAVLDETLRVTLPAGRYVQVTSPNHPPEVHEDAAGKTYTWKSTHRDPPTDDKPKPPRHPPTPDVQVTSFRNWAEVGRWWDALQKSQVEPSPAVRAKAAEITAGLKTEDEKLRAIYAFVSLKFRYISLSLGEARYQPHSADEVLANQYGDCKDKHTLLAALLRAAGIEAWPALIGAGLGFDPAVPSPAQFNHVITYVPRASAPLWLDSTPEVAPFGLLSMSIRDHQALVIPPAAAAEVKTTPAAPPFAASEKISVEGKLNGEGTLSARLDMSTRGDDELLLRATFHATAPAQWQTLAENLAAGMGYGGTASELDVDNPANLDAPLHLSFHYERKNYGDWEHRRITAPLPPFTLLSTEDADKFTEPADFGIPGTSEFRSKIELPPGYSLEIPGDVHLQTPFADYTSSYTVDHGALTVDRVFVVKVPKLAVDRWDAYCKFAKAVVADESQFIQLVRGDTATARVVRDVPEAAELVQRAAEAAQRRDFNTARDALAQAERLNPQQAGLWLIRAMIYGVQIQNEQALDALRKELEYHPGNEIAYRLMAALQQQMGRKDDAIATLRKLVELAPSDAESVAALVQLLFDAKRYRDAVEPLRTALKGDPENARLGSLLVEALIRGGQKSDGLAELAKMRDRKLDASTLNSLAWSLADTNTEPAAARDLAARAVTDYESQLQSVTIATVSSEHFKTVGSLGATWDTAGWAAFDSGDLAAAERYIRAAWMLIQDAVTADHLGQIYERQGKKDDAIHAYRLALALKSDMPETRARLEKLGGSPGDRPTLRRGKPTKPWTPTVSPEEEVSRLRTVPLPDLPYRRGTADFFILFSSAKVEDVQFIRGDEALKPAAAALRKAAYEAPFPDSGPEKIIRRGILSCSEVTKPACSLVLMLPANTTN